MFVNSDGYRSATERNLNSRKKGREILMTSCKAIGQWCDVGEIGLKFPRNCLFFGHFFLSYGWQEICSGRGRARLERNPDRLSQKIQMIRQRTRSMERMAPVSQKQRRERVNEFVNDGKTDIK